MVSGANTAAIAAEASRTSLICPAVAVPAIAARAVVTRWVTGLASTTACSQIGMVRGSTKMLLARVSGNSTTDHRLPGLYASAHLISEGPSPAGSLARHACRGRASSTTGIPGIEVVLVLVVPSRTVPRLIGRTPDRLREIVAAALLSRLGGTDAGSLDVMRVPGI